MIISSQISAIHAAINNLAISNTGETPVDSVTKGHNTDSMSVDPMNNQCLQYVHQPVTITAYASKRRGSAESTSQHSENQLKL